jgi:23S rRNA (guanine2445-N2)-methyltransferase / 23S rRNA (guanine2069-N7)-methyltransferase
MPGGARSTLDRSFQTCSSGRDAISSQRFRREHQLLRADCLPWLEEQAQLGERGPRFGLIFLDPPTFSVSKRAQSTLAVQRDHAQLIKLAARLLTPRGKLVFSTNFQRFRLDRAALAQLRIEDLSAQSIPRDFARHANIHQCFAITSS